MSASPITGFESFLPEMIGKLTTTHIRLISRVWHLSLLNCRRKRIIEMGSTEQYGDLNQYGTFSNILVLKVKVLDLGFPLILKFKQ